MLHYCLKDDNYDDLVGISLIPLASHNCGTFQTSSKNNIYLGSNEEQEILVGMEDRFVSNEMDEELRKKFSLMHGLNIRGITSTDFTHHLEDMLEKQWGNLEVITTDHQNEKFNISWVTKFWEYAANNKLEITLLQNLPLIPSSLNHFHRISGNTSLLLGKPNELDAILLKIGCHFVDEKFHQYEFLLRPYTHATDGIGILQAIHNVGNISLFDKLNDTERFQLRNYLCSSMWCSSGPHIDTFRVLQYCL